MTKKKKLQMLLEEIGKQMANRSVFFSAYLVDETCKLDAQIIHDRSIRDIIEHAWESHIIDDHLRWKLSTYCWYLWPGLTFYAEHNDTGFYIKYSYYDDFYGRFPCDNGVILTPEEGAIGPMELSDRIIKVVDNSFRTMYVSDKITFDIPEPNYRLYNANGLHSCSAFAGFVTNALMLRDKYLK